MEVSGRLHASAALPPGKKPCTHWIGGWVGRRAGLDAVARREIPTPLAGNPLISPIVQPVA
jgi:hypothetical protein